MSYNYPLKDNDKQKMLLMMEAELLNLSAEEEVLTALLDFTYSGKVFNKRYETQLNKFLADRFGVVKIDQPYNGDKTHYNNISAYMYDDTGYNDIKKYSLSITYSGNDVVYNSDTQGYQGRKSTQSHKFYSVISHDDVIESATARIKGIKESSRPSIMTAITELDDLIAEHNRIDAQMRAFNDRVPYIVSDLLRIR